MKYKKEFILLIITLFICFIIFETAVRILNWPVPIKAYPNQMQIYDETKGFALRPNFHGVFPSTNISIDINSKGLRDYEHDFNKTEKTRILILGDSVTFGSGTYFEDAYPSILERKLNKKGYNVEIIKSGVGGYDLYQEHTYYFEEGYKYNPDIVMIGVVLNDIVGPNLTLLKESFEKYGSDRKDDSKVEQAVKKICHSCVFLYSVIYNYNKIYADIIYSYWEDDFSFEKYAAQIIQIHHNLKTKNASLILAVFPYTWQFKNSGQHKGLTPQQRLRGLAQKEKIFFIDLAPSLDIKNYKDYYLPYERLHLNQKGNKIVADAIYNEMLKQEIIKPNPDSEIKTSKNSTQDLLWQNEKLKNNSDLL